MFLLLFLFQAALNAISSLINLNIQGNPPTEEQGPVNGFSIHQQNHYNSNPLTRLS